MTERLFLRWKDRRFTHTPHDVFNVVLQDGPRQNTYANATDNILSYWHSPRNAGLFQCSLCFHYVLIPVDASEGPYMSTVHIWVCKWHIVCAGWKWTLFFVFTSTENVFCWAWLQGFFHFNRCTVNSNEFCFVLFVFFKQFGKKREREKKISPDMYLKSAACISTVSFGKKIIIWCDLMVRYIRNGCVFGEIQGFLGLCL